MPDDMVELREKVARAMKKARCDRMGLPHRFDPEGPICPGDLCEAEAAIAATDREELVAALTEAAEALALGVRVPSSDPRIDAEVIRLGEKYGYGALMATASHHWRNALGDLAGGEFVSGPCRSTAETALAKARAALKGNGNG